MANIKVCDGCSCRIQHGWHYVFEYYEVFEDGKHSAKRLLHLCSTQCFKDYARELGIL